MTIITTIQILVEVVEKIFEVRMKDIKFMKLGEKERKILLTAFNYKLDKLKCQFCGKKVDYKDCGIMPSTDKRRTATIICGYNPLCMCEYLRKVEER